MVKCEITNNTS